MSDSSNCCCCWSLYEPQVAHVVVGNARRGCQRRRVQHGELGVHRSQLGETPTLVGDVLDGASLSL